MSWVVPGHLCPECGSPVVYNGNYYCQELERRHPCWAMAVDIPLSEHSDWDLSVMRTHMEERRQEGGVTAIRMDFYLKPIYEEIESRSVVDR